jgi:uncharacterized protein with NRDE domain
MCTILYFYRVHPVYPLVVAANRDEYYDRPAVGPRLLSTHPRSVGALDLHKKGTWLGVNEKGLFVGLTNQRTHRGADPSARSRGEIVCNLLESVSVDAMLEQLWALDHQQYNPFNLLFGDARRLYLAYARTEFSAITIEPAPQGIHALANDRLDSPEFPRAVRAEQLAEPIRRLDWPELVPALVGVISDHQLASLELVPEPPADSMYGRDALRQLQAICIHTGNYGTRSATIIALTDHSVAHYLFAAGPPCQTPFEDVTDLLLDSSATDR